MIEPQISLLEEILDEFKSEIGVDFPGYKNHVYRMIHFCFAQGELGEEGRTKVIIAGCFHDIGIWTAGTFDYLPPSIEAANEYLQRNGRQQWVSEVGLMIGQHHKVREYKSDPLIEIFRKGDLADFSLGLLRSGVPRNYIKAVKAQFPNAGFHKKLVRLAGAWICRHPLNPIPVLKW